LVRSLSEPQVTRYRYDPANAIKRQIDNGAACLSRDRAIPMSPTHHLPQTIPSVRRLLVLERARQFRHFAGLLVLLGFQPSHRIGGLVGKNLACADLRELALVGPRGSNFCCPVLRIFYWPSRSAGSIKKAIGTLDMCLSELDIKRSRLTVLSWMPPGGKELAELLAH
jgi:hypothetical protein